MWLLALIVFCSELALASSWFAQEVITASATGSNASQIRRLSPLDNTVLGASYPPTFDDQPSEPEFHVYTEAFEKLLGSHPKVRRIAHVPGYAFAHEAPIWFKETNEVFFSAYAQDDCKI